MGVDRKMRLEGDFVSGQERGKLCKWPGKWGRGWEAAGLQDSDGKWGLAFFFFWYMIFKCCRFSIA
jgi:hypothetical protein